MRKNLEYYLNLNYAVEVRKIAQEDGGGYLASIPELGRWAFCGSGESIDEAMKTLDIVKKNLFEEYLEEGKEIPEPETESESVFSGKFVIRIPPDLHRLLVEKARGQKASLNQYVTYLLAFNTPLDVLEKCLRKLETAMSKIKIKPVYIVSHQATKEGYLYRT